MTEAIKQWIADQALKEYPIPPKFIGPANAEMDRAAFSAGLEKGIEIAEGFSEWATPRGWRFNSISQMFENINPAAADLTTSQLLERYLLTLENK